MKGRNMIPKAKPELSTMLAMLAELDNVYEIMCSGKPPFTERETQARRELRKLIKKYKELCS